MKQKNLYNMSKKKKKITQPIDEVEIISRRDRSSRKINLNNKEIIIYNKELNEFQLLSVVSASYDKDREPKND
tara:strand:+ start:121 stop:339 length:219 start_codon:yes stop_codon:yes gene_type:complete